MLDESLYDSYDEESVREGEQTLSLSARRLVHEPAPELKPRTCARTQTLSHAPEPRESERSSHPPSPLTPPLTTLLVQEVGRLEKPERSHMCDGTFSHV